jgi:peptidoglycan/xylan/chitin deacetylase (PgdA/CDA1 family)
MAQKSNSRTLTSSTRRIAKRLAIKSGGLALYHRARHRNVLTVLMFHRVLPQDLIAAYYADEEYTISTTLLKGLMAFVARHYNIVSLHDVLRSRNREAPLPGHPLLITFDDGWDDNAIFAAPIFAQMKVPWTLFAATEGVESGPLWWQETLLSALRSGSVEYEILRNAALNAARYEDREIPDDQALSILLLYGTLPSAERDGLIATYCGKAAPSGRPRDMVTWDKLRTLHENGVAIGGHGASHLPLTMVENPQHELSRSHSELRRNIGSDASLAMSFPHGCYSGQVVEAARGEGVKLLFTSDSVLNNCPGGWLSSDILGRISLSTANITNSLGALSQERLMPWLMLRPRATL